MSDPIDELLTESELAHDTALRELLGEIAREATAVRPIPSAELSELMSPPSAGARRVRRSFAGRRAVITGVVVIGALGLGATAAAASPEARSAIGAGIAVIAHLFEPGDPGTGPHPVTPVPDESDSRMPSPASTAAHTPSASTDATPAAHGNAGSSGHSSHPTSRSSNPAGSHGNGNGSGNQSGHGNGGGQGNGGPAPTP